MGAVKDTFLREVERYSRHKIIPLITVVFPLLIAILFTVMFSSQVLRVLPVVVCDQDKSPTSMQLVSMLKQKGSLEVTLVTGSVTQAREVFNRKEAVAVVYIPKDFEKGILGVSGTQIKAEVDGVYMSRGSIAYKELMTIFQAFNVGVEAKVLTAKGISPETAMEIAYPVVMDQHVLYNPYANYAFFLLPGLFPIIIVVSSFFASIYAVGSEFRYGTASEWLKGAGGSISKALLGKLLLYFIIYQIEFLFFNTIIFKYLGLMITAREFFMVELCGVLMIFTYMMVGMAFIALFHSMRLSLSLATFYGVAAFSFSGLAFPTMAMPTAIQILGYAFPFYYYMRLFIDCVLRSNPDTMIFIESIGMFLIFITIMLLTVPVLKRNCNQPKTYGKL